MSQGGKIFGRIAETCRFLVVHVLSHEVMFTDSRTYTMLWILHIFCHTTVLFYNQLLQFSMLCIFIFYAFACLFFKELNNLVSIAFVFMAPGKKEVYEIDYRDKVRACVYISPPALFCEQG